MFLWMKLSTTVNDKNWNKSSSDEVAKWHSLVTTFINSSLPQVHSLLMDLAALRFSNLVTFFVPLLLFFTNV